MIIKMMKNTIKRVCYFVSNLYGKYIRPVKILSSIETIQLIKDKKLCASRYGDGEFSICWENRSISFQENAGELGSKLLTVLQSGEDNLLVCVPLTINSLDNFAEFPKFFWEDYLSIRKIRILRHLDKNKVYGNSLFTRPYMDYEDKNRNNEIFDNILDLVRDQDLLVVEGIHTRSGVGNDLFAGAKSIQRIVCPARNAYNKYDEIFEAIKAHGENKLILISLGPTATVLAYDLAKEKKFWAIDLGHLDVEYEWYCSHALTKTQLTGKYVAEVGGDFKKELCEDVLKEYTNQIVARID